MLITLKEMLYFVVLTIGIGYIFMGMFKYRVKTVYHYMNPKKFDLRDFYFAIAVAAPAVILHELGHKFTAISFGFNASFEVFWIGLALGIFLKLISSPFLIIAPAFVTFPVIGMTDLQYRMTAFAGPAVNLLLFLVAMAFLKFKKEMNLKETAFWAFTKKLNLLLFIFNMIPFGPLDGAKVFFGLG